MSRNIHTARKFWDAVKIWDSAEAFKCVHPDAVIHEAAGLPYAGEYYGPTGLGQLLEKIFDLFDLDIRSFDLYDADEVVVARLNAVFKRRESGKILETSVIEVYRFTDGLISDMDVFYKDTKAVADLLA